MHRRWWIATALGGAFLLLYLATTVRGVLTADNAEFQRVGAQLGVAHPPGFALYTLLAHLATLLPGGWSAAVKINALSAVITALTIAVIYAIADLLLDSRLAAVVSALAYGTLTTVWAQATTANVRSLTALFAALMLWALLAWRQARRVAATRAAAATYNDRAVIGFALALGFGVTHHLSLAFMGLAAVVWLLWRDWRVWPHLLWSAIGLLPILYLPLRDATLRDLPTLLRYVLGLGFGGDFFAFITPAALWARAGVMLNVLTFQTSPLVLGAAAAGLVWLLLNDRSAAVLLGGTFLVHSFITATYRAPQTVEYMLPAYVPLALLAGAACAQRAGRWLAPAISLLLVGVTLLHAGRLWPSMRALAQPGYTSGAAVALLNAAPPNAELLTNWHWHNTLLYAQAVDGARPDVTITYVAPGGEPYGATWRRLIAGGLARGSAVVATNGFGAVYADLPPSAALADPAASAYGFGMPPLDALPATFEPAAIVLGERIAIAGYRLDRSTAAVGEPAALVVAWRALGDGPPAALFVHLVDPAQRLLAQADVSALAVADGLTLTRFELTPRPGALPGAHQVLIGGYLADGSALSAADGAARTPLADLTVTGSAWRPVTLHPQRLTLDDRTLVGVDFDQTLADRPRIYLHWRAAEGGYYSETVDAPSVTVGDRSYAIDDYCHPRCHYLPLAGGIVWLGEQVRGEVRPGAQVQRTQRFAAARPIVADLTVSVSLTGLAADGVTWEWQVLSDGIPALGAIPTLKWVAGTRVQDPHRLRVPAAAVAGQAVEARLILYDAFTQRTLPVLDERVAEQGIGIPLDRSTVAP